MSLKLGSKTYAIKQAEESVQNLLKSIHKDEDIDLAIGGTHNE